MRAVTIIGIDPGSRHTGWGAVREASGVLQLVDCGVIHTLSAGKSFSARLAHIYHALFDVVGRLQPDAAAIEQVFTAQNPATALKLGQARGVAVAVCAAHGLDVSDYEPALVKKSLVGTGRAEKEQVAFMVKRLLNVRAAKWALDASDALAIAICHATTLRLASLSARCGGAPRHPDALAR